MGAIGCPKTSVNGYQYMLRNIPEERRPQLHRERRLKGRKIIKLASEFGDSIMESYKKTFHCIEQQSAAEISLHSVEW
jgi:hypothetical protein